MTARVATKAEVLAFVDAGPKPELAAEWVHTAYDAAIGETYQYVNENDDDEIVGFGFMGQYGPEDASPPGWWLAYVWNDPDAATVWDLAELAIIDFAELGHTFVRSACMGPKKCGGRCTPFVGSVNRDKLPYPPGTAGYYAVPGEWRLLTEGSHRGEVLYVVDAIDTGWTPPESG